MNPQVNSFFDPPTLSDKTACEMLDFLHQLICVFEYHYAEQLLHYHQPIDPPESDNLYDGFDDDLPPF